MSKVVCRLCQKEIEMPKEALGKTDRTEVGGLCDRCMSALKGESGQGAGFARQEELRSSPLRRPA